MKNCVEHKKKVRFSALVTKEAAFYREPGPLSSL